MSVCAGDLGDQLRGAAGGGGGQLVPGPHHRRQRRLLVHLQHQLVQQHRQVHDPLRSPLELETNLREVFAITKKAFSWFKAPTGTFTFKTLLRHY